MNNKRGQMTAFIIIAVIIVAGIAGYFLFLNNIQSQEKIPASLEPVYLASQSCLEQYAKRGIDIMESQGGYIEVPEFEPGSAYAPFSNQLNFLGNPIPYWYYLSGNNIEKEQVPSKAEMESQLKGFIEENMKDCRFDNYYDEGFEINFNPDDFKADVTINENEVLVDLKSNLGITKGNESVVVESQKVSVSSELGNLYESARKVYDYEQESLFLENYSVDILRLYAPVDGVEISCSPKIWQAEDVFSQLREAIEANTQALKSSGKENDYFVVKLPLSNSINARFLNSKKWPNSFEVNPTKDDSSVLMATPVGNQPGLGIMGFCYVPYHFVYNVKYPVLVQLTSEKTNEIFQFPLAVILQGNKPRKPVQGASAVDAGLPEFCKYKNADLKVRTYDTKLNPVDNVKISYECFGTKCDIGKTDKGVLKEKFPQCVNGYVLASAEGFKNKKELYSTTQDGEVDIILDKLYELNVELNLDNKPYNREAIIIFTSVDSSDNKNSKTLIYPSQRRVNLSQGQYEISVQIYQNSSLKLAGNTIEQCVDISQSGIGGLLGFTKKECFNIEIPEQIISSALAGGGKENYYILEQELENSDTLEINAESLSTPKTIEELQNNYILFEDKGLDVVFK